LLLFGVHFFSSAVLLNKIKLYLKKKQKKTQIIIKYLNQKKKNGQM